MTAHATAQVNSRMAPGLKAAGDAGLAAAGLNPTKAVNALWALAVRYKDSPELLLQALYPDQAKQQAEDAACVRAHRRDLIEQGPEIVRQAFTASGSNLRDSVLNLPVAELKRAAYEEKIGTAVFDA